MWVLIRLKTIECLFSYYRYLKLSVPTNLQSTVECMLIEFQSKDERGGVRARVPIDSIIEQLDHTESTASMR